MPWPPPATTEIPPPRNLNRRRSEVSQIGHKTKTPKTDRQIEKECSLFRIHLARRRKKAATDEIASSGLLTTHREPRSKATARNLPSSSPPPAQHRSSFKQSFLNGTPKKREKKWWTRAQRDEIRRSRPAEEQKEGVKKKQQDEAMEQRSEGLQRNVVSHYEKTLSRWGKCVGRQVGKKAKWDQTLRNRYKHRHLPTHST